MLRPEPSRAQVRPASPDDAAAIAALQTRSWRATYRGSFSDAYLDGPIDAERRAFWAQRLDYRRQGLITLVADGEGELCGFLCALADHDPAWGTLIDNLHVDPDRKRSGLGRVLMRAGGERLGALGSSAPIHLFVLAANRDAATFYERLGGEAVERMVKTEPDGSVLPVERIVWPSVEAFLTAVGPG